MFPIKNYRSLIGSDVLERDIKQQRASRVRQRVAAGGHNVSEDVIRRRFHAGMRNFERMYKPLVNEWELFDNSGKEPVRLDENKV